MRAQLYKPLVTNRERAVDDWLEIIADAAEQRWTAGRPLFFAQIPSLLQGAEVDLREVLRGRTLKEALELEGGQRFQLVNDPNRTNVWAIIPNAAPKDISLDALFTPMTEPQNAPVSVSRPIPRFKKSFWAAFIRSLSPGKKRYVSRDGFEDISENDLGPAVGIPVNPDDIVSIPPGAQVDTDAVYSAIRIWAERTGAKLGDYLAAGPSQQRHSLSLDLIDPEDMKRIMVPLDVVLKLLRRRP
jgi:hypothetical protein